MLIYRERSALTFGLHCIVQIIISGARGLTRGMSSYLVIVDDSNTTELRELADAETDRLSNSTPNLPSQSVRHGGQAQSSSREYRLLVLVMVGRSLLVCAGVSLVLWRGCGHLDISITHGVDGKVSILFSRHGFCESALFNLSVSSAFVVGGTLGMR